MVNVRKWAKMGENGRKKFNYFCFPNEIGGTLPKIL